MKHAILILAYNNFEILNHLVDYFKIDCYVLIHIDKKVVVNDDLMLELKAKSQVVDVYQKFTIHWGGYSILECELFLLKEAIRLTDANYFHLISGQDYPIKPLSVFLRYFDQRNGWEFISYVHIPHKNFQENTYDRFCYYLPYDLWNCINIQVDCCIMYDCVLCYFYLTYKGYINDDLTISYVYALNNKSYLQENILYHKKGAVNFNHEPIGNIAFNLKNGVLDASLMLKIKKNQNIADFYII